MVLSYAVDRVSGPCHPRRRPGDRPTRRPRRPRSTQLDRHRPSTITMIDFKRAWARLFGRPGRSRSTKARVSDRSDGVFQKPAAPRAPNRTPSTLSPGLACACSGSFRRIPRSAATRTRIDVPERRPRPSAPSPITSLRSLRPRYLRSRITAAPPRPVPSEHLIRPVEVDGDQQA
jgi:hypothetical protein